VKSIGICSNIDVTVSSQHSPGLADALKQGRLDAAFMRPEPNSDDLVYRRVITECFIFVFPSDHRLAANDAVELQEIVGETFLIPSANTTPKLRSLIEEFLQRSGLDINPKREMENMGHAVSMIAATRAVALLPAYAKSFLPWSLTSRPILGDAPTVDLVVGYDKSNTSPILTLFLTRINDLAARGWARPVNPI
jgi:LysR family transcriptional regulator, hca operon transcriptional activator